MKIVPFPGGNIIAFGDGQTTTIWS